MEGEAKVNRRRHTKPCHYFQTNDCPFTADTCDYLHVKLPQNQYLSFQGPKDTLRTKPCRFFALGRCKDGNWCRFKHVLCQKPPGSEPDVDEASNENDVDVRDYVGWKAKPEQHPKYRTRPCRKYLLGKCRYGERCSYLHEDQFATTLQMHSTPSVGVLSYLSPPLTPSSSGSVDSSLGFLSGGETTPSTQTDFHGCLPLSENHTQPAKMKNLRDLSGASTTSTNSSIPVTPSKSDAIDDGDINIWSPISSTFPYNCYASAVGSDLSLFSDTMLLASNIPMLPSLYTPMQPLLYHNSVPHYDDTPHNLVGMPPDSGIDSQWRSLDSYQEVKTPNSTVFRSKPCKYFESGKCRKGVNCDFKHCFSSSRPVTSPSDTKVLSKQRITVPIKNLQSEETSQDYDPSNFYPVNYRIVSGNVIMSKKFDTDSNKVGNWRKQREGKTRLHISVNDCDPIKNNSSKHDRYCIPAKRKNIPPIIISDSQDKKETSCQNSKSDDCPSVDAGDSKLGFDLSAANWKKSIKSKSSPSSPVFPPVELPSAMQFAAELP